MSAFDLKVAQSLSLHNPESAKVLDDLKDITPEEADPQGAMWATPNLSRTPPGGSVTLIAGGHSRSARCHQR